LVLKEKAFEDVVGLGHLTLVLIALVLDFEFAA